MTLKEKETLYLKAKKTYYDGEPIMTDSAFDLLEKELVEANSGVINIVGAFDRKAKHKHMTPMVSLDKIQANKETGEAPVLEFNEWVNKMGIKSDVLLQYEQKLDGNAINIIYINGKADKALSRGDGELGFDYLKRLNKEQIPSEIPNKNKVEIRCEAVIPLSIFNEKYLKNSSDDEGAKFSNARNYVAGILRNDNSTREQLDEIHVIPVEYREVSEDGKIIYHNIDEIKNFGFKHFDKLVSIRATASDFEKQFNFFENFRQNVSGYKIDGIVIKTPFEYREKIGETDHHPNWAVAIKFKPENSSTKTLGLELKIGKTGNFTPVVLLEPVDLDGSVVTKASGYNYKFITENLIGEGAIVTLVKSGDIIPQIISVDVMANTPFEMPTKCPHCGNELKIVNDTHLNCDNFECYGRNLYRFISSMDALNIDGVGEAFLEKLYDCGLNIPMMYIGQDFITSEFFIENGMKEGKILDNFVENLNKIKKLTIEQVISLFSFDKMSLGGKTTREVAKKLSGVSYSFFGLEKDVVSKFEDGCVGEKAVREAIEILKSRGIEVEMMKEKPTDTFKVCLTGSPKPFGFNTKKEFITFLESKGFSVEETNVKECQYLVTDDLSSNSSKMKDAKNKNKNIVQYDYFSK